MAKIIDTGFALTTAVLWSRPVTFYAQNANVLRQLKTFLQCDAPIRYTDYERNWALDAEFDVGKLAEFQREQGNNIFCEMNHAGDIIIHVRPKGDEDAN